jgi:hypothetical protein
MEGRATSTRSTGPPNSARCSRNDSRSNLFTRLRTTAPPILAPATTPSRVADPAGKRNQLATRHPHASRPPCSRTRAKSRPCLIRIARPKPRRWARSVIRSNRSQALATGTTAARNRGGSALGLVAPAESMLALAANLRRLVLAFHNSVNLFPSLDRANANGRLQTGQTERGD